MCFLVGIIRMKRALSLFPHIPGPPPQSPSVSFATCHVHVLTVYHFLSNHCFLPPLSPVFFLPEVPVSSVLCLSSVRELPVQVRDLYAQGFVLVAVHPFVHPCGPRHAHIQRQLHRAVLVRETPRYANWTDPCVQYHQFLYRIKWKKSNSAKRNHAITIGFDDPLIFH